MSSFGKLLGDRNRTTKTFCCFIDFSDAQEIIENPQSMDVDEIEQSSSDFPSESVKNDTPIVEVKTETA